jgi:hypothetical protein
VKCIGLEILNYWYIDNIYHFKYSIFSNRNPILLVDFFWNLTKASRQYKKDCEFVHTVSEEIIDKRQLELVSFSTCQ